MDITITDLAGLDAYRPTPRPCNHEGPYLVKVSGNGHKAVLCNRPVMHRGEHSYSTPTAVRLAAWTPEGVRLHPKGSTVIHPPPGRQRRG